MYAHRPAGQSAGFFHVRGDEMLVLLGDLLDPQEREQLIKAFGLPSWEHMRRAIAGETTDEEPLREEAWAGTTEEWVALMEERPAGVLAAEV